MIISSIDTEKQVFIIAEIGNNHEGDEQLAADLIGRAAEAGVDAVKFQTIVPERLTNVRDADRIQQLRRFQLGYDAFERLAEVASREGVIFLSTPFDVESARVLRRIVPAYKIASGDNTFYPLLDAVIETGKPILLSTGMLGLEKIAQIKKRIESGWTENDIEQDLALLHCVVSYPTSPEDANLSAILDLKRLGSTVGYSDHTLGITAAVLSVALGARIIEKHFTISHTYSDFRDHQLSADPVEMAELVERVREAETLLGHGEKRPAETEKDIEVRVRRSIVARRDLDEGLIVSWDDLEWVRPGGGLPPGSEGVILGKSLARPLKQGEMILAADVR